MRQLPGRFFQAAPSRISLKGSGTNNTTEIKFITNTIFDNPPLRLKDREIKKLSKELQRKESALAETAAILVLRKKINAIAPKGVSPPGLPQGFKALKYAS